MNLIAPLFKSNLKQIKKDLEKDMTEIIETRFVSSEKRPRDEDSSVASKEHISKKSKQTQDSIITLNMMRKRVKKAVKQSYKPETS